MYLVLSQVWQFEMYIPKPNLKKLEGKVLTEPDFIPNNGILKLKFSVLASSKGYILQYTP